MGIDRPPSLIRVLCLVRLPVVVSWAAAFGSRVPRAAAGGGVSGRAGTVVDDKAVVSAMVTLDEGMSGEIASD